MIDLSEDNISWEASAPFLPGQEPWEPDEDFDDGKPAGACAYCGTNDNIRENPEPFGGQQCCESCFNMLIGGDEDDPPWRCGTVT